jgi:YfiH family protein
MHRLGDYNLIEAVGLTSGVLAGTIAAVDCNGDCVDFKAETEEGERTRKQLEELMAPLPIVWLSLQHGVEIIRLPLDGSVEPVGSVESGGATEFSGSIKSSGVCEPGGSSGSASQCDPADKCDSAGELAGTNHPAVLRPQADGVLITQPDIAVAFTTADCLPVILSCKGGANSRGPLAVAIHAGWRGLADGIVEAAVEKLCAEAGCSPSDLSAWIGPGIDPAHYEIDGITRERLLSRPAVNSNAKGCFTPTPPDHWFADLPEMADSILWLAGLKDNRIKRCKLSTYTSGILHSARRDGEASGRMATICFLQGDQTPPSSISFQSQTPC